MDIEYDSDLDEIEGFDLNDGIQPYMFIPMVLRNQADASHEKHSSSESESEEEADPQHLPGTDPSEWCTCTNCMQMPTLLESGCCRENDVVSCKVEEQWLQCIIEHEGFLGNCLNIHVVEASYYTYIEQEGFPV